jgi:hypothetical protein
MAGKQRCFAFGKKRPKRSRGGRRPTGAKAGVSHARRPVVRATQPQHRAPRGRQLRLVVQQVGKVQNGC